MSKKPVPAPGKEVTKYLARYSGATLASLHKMRKIIKTIVPEAEEATAYGILVFKHEGRGLVGIGGFEDHCGFYLMSVAVAKSFKKELAEYDTSTATVRFPIGKTLPQKLVEKIVKARIDENSKLKAKKVAKKSVVTTKAKAAPSTDPVAAYMAKLKHPMKEDVEALRKLIKRAGKELNERIKWNAPSYYTSKDLFTFSLHNKNYILLVFHHPAIVKIQSKVLEGNYESRRLTYFRNSNDIRKNSKELVSVIKKLIRLSSGSAR
jgi:uncharacterized protein YdhG (YjbR/CyaY superfamily)